MAIGRNEPLGDQTSSSPLGDGHLLPTSLQQAEDVPHLMAQFDTRRWWAWMLLRRAGVGDRERAVELLEAAISGYKRLQASLSEAIATEMLSSATE